MHKFAGSHSKNCNHQPAVGHLGALRKGLWAGSWDNQLANPVASWWCNALERWVFPLTCQSQPTGQSQKSSPIPCFHILKRCCNWTVLPSSFCKKKLESWDPQAEPGTKPWNTYTEIHKEVMSSVLLSRRSAQEFVISTRTRLTSPFAFKPSFSATFPPLFSFFFFI